MLPGNSGKSICIINSTSSSSTTEVTLFQALVDITVDDILLDETIQDHVEFLTNKYGPSIMLEMIFKIGIDGKFIASTFYY